MAYQKKLFPVDARVRINNTASPLDGKTGTVLARLGSPYSPSLVTDDYIVMYDEPVEGNRALVITEACLEAR
jgi:hypothetical protein